MSQKGGHFTEATFYHDCRLSRREDRGGAHTSELLGHKRGALIRAFDEK